MKKSKNYVPLNSPIMLPDHHKPVTRRDFIAQGFMAGAGSVVGGSLLSMFPNRANALSTDIQNFIDANCDIGSGAGKIPFICFDLAGGANFAGSNVLVGGPGGQGDFLSTAGYSKLGLPGDMVPGVTETTPAAGSNGDHTNTQLGLAFHSDSALLKGILKHFTPPAPGSGGINGAVIPARSDNDTGNNPHNPMYGIAKAGPAGMGANGGLLQLIGSRSSDSGGNSMAPADMIDLGMRPTKVDRPSDVLGLVDLGKLINDGSNGGLLDRGDAVTVLESIQRISQAKLGNIDPKTASDDELRDLINCVYAESAHIAEVFGDPGTFDVRNQFVDVHGVISGTEFDGDSEIRKAASVAHLVVNGYAGAGTVTMGGYDYHTGDRVTGEQRDFRAGECMGLCLAYAASVGVPLFLYVMSDGSVASNGRVDGGTATDPDSGASIYDGNKGEWTGDNSSTACSFFLVYDPNNGLVTRSTVDFGGPQIGYMRPDASVETSATPAANNVNLLVETVILNYMALHGEEAQFATSFPSHGLGNSTLQDSLTAFQAIVSGTI